MRRFVICAAAVAALAFSTNNAAEAGTSAPAVRATVPAGFFSRLMDLERRKNAMLLRIFGFR